MIPKHLYKGKGDPKEMSLAKILYEKILDNRVKTSIEFTDLQAGGRPNCSTTDELFILTSLINQAKYDKKKLYIVLFDKKTAYD